MNSDSKKNGLPELRESKLETPRSLESPETGSGPTDVSPISPLSMASPNALALGNTHDNKKMSVRSTILGDGLTVRQSAMVLRALTLRISVDQRISKMGARGTIQYGECDNLASPIGSPKSGKNQGDVGRSSIHDVVEELMLDSINEVQNRGSIVGTMLRNSRNFSANRLPSFLFKSFDISEDAEYMDDENFSDALTEFREQFAKIMGVQRLTQIGTKSNNVDSETGVESCTRRLSTSDVEMKANNFIDIEEIVARHELQGTRSYPLNAFGKPVEYTMSNDEQIYCREQDFPEIPEFVPQSMANETTDTKKKKKRGRRAAKFACRFYVGILDEPKFSVAKRIIGPQGRYMKSIANSVGGSIIELRGIGSGYRGTDPEQVLETMTEPLYIYVSIPYESGFKRVKSLVEKLIRSIYDDYFAFCGIQINMEQPVPVHLNNEYTFNTDMIRESTVPHVV